MTSYFSILLFHFQWPMGYWLSADVEEIKMTQDLNDFQELVQHFLMYAFYILFNLVQTKTKCKTSDCFLFFLWVVEYSTITSLGAVKWLLDSASYFIWWNKIDISLFICPQKANLHISNNSKLLKPGSPVHSQHIAHESQSREIRHFLKLNGKFILLNQEHVLNH